MRGGTANAFLILALDGGEWSALPSRKQPPGTCWIGGWMGSRASLDVMVKRKISSLCRDSNP